MDTSQRYLGLVVALLAPFAMSAHSVAQEASTAAPPAEALAAYQAGLEQMSQENWNAAIGSFTQAAQIYPDYSDALVGRGDAYRELEDYASASSSYGMAITINQESARAYFGQAICFREQRKFDLASHAFYNAEEFDRTDPEIIADYGDFLLNYLGEIPNALRYLDRAVELDDTNPKVFANRAWANAQMGNFEEALADVMKSDELEPDKYETYGILANIYLIQDDIPPALAAITQAINAYKPEKSNDPPILTNAYMNRVDASLRLALKDDTSQKQREELYEGILADTDIVLDETPELGRALHRRGLPCGCKVALASQLLHSPKPSLRRLGEVMIPIWPRPI